MELFIDTAILVAFFLFLYVSGVFLLSVLMKDNSIMDIAYGPAFFVSTFLTMLYTVSFGTLPSIVIACIALWSARLGIRIFRKNKGSKEDERYAKWRHEWMERGYGYFLLRSYGQVYLLQGVIIFLIALPATIALAFGDVMHPAFLFVGLVVFILGLTYETTADWQLDTFIAKKKAGTTDKTLMTEGLFRYSRRPNYFGETLIWWGLAIMVLPIPFGWIAIVSPLVITYIVKEITGPMLENNFLERYPEEYGAYMKSANFMLPNFSTTKKNV